MLGEDKPQDLETLAHLGLAVGGRGLGTPHGAPGWETGMAWVGRGMAGAGRRDCHMPMSFCSLQLARDRSRADEYLQQSLWYLEAAQPSLQKEAVRFIGEPQPRGPSFGSVDAAPAAVLARACWGAGALTQLCA